ncbi:MAG: hypothetical protein IPM51_00415 [Sphingobacteriaceae bacterium]|nr:hypothetical protein [Sphingobacteriaceae bacterium]
MKTTLIQIFIFLTLYCASQNRYDTPTQQKYESTHTTSNLDLLLKLAQAQEEAEEKKREDLRKKQTDNIKQDQEYNNYNTKSNNQSQIEENKKKELRLKNEKQIQKIQDLYANAPSYPVTLIDGVYNCEFVDQIEGVVSLKVYVQKNKITHFVKNNEKDVPIPFSSSITKGKALVKTICTMIGEPTRIEDTYYDVYFIETIYK